MQQIIRANQHRVDDDRNAGVSARRHDNTQQDREEHDKAPELQQELHERVLPQGPERRHVQLHLLARRQAEGPHELTEQTWVRRERAARMGSPQQKLNSRSERKRRLDARETSLTTTWRYYQRQTFTSSTHKSRRPSAPKSFQGAARILSSR